jgi:hypothetical protein
MLVEYSKIGKADFFMLGVRWDWVYLVRGLLVDMLHRPIIIMMMMMMNIAK